MGRYAHLAPIPMPFRVLILVVLMTPCMIGNMNAMIFHATMDSGAMEAGARKQAKQERRSKRLVQPAPRPMPHVANVWYPEDHADELAPPSTSSGSVYVWALLSLGSIVLAVGAIAFAFFGGGREPEPTTEREGSALD